MTIYAVGDIQGCVRSFEGLLKAIGFDPEDVPQHFRFDCFEQELEGRIRSEHIAHIDVKIAPLSKIQDLAQFTERGARRFVD